MRIDAQRLSTLLTIVFVAAGVATGVWLGLDQIRGAASVLDRVEYLTLDWRFLLAGPHPAPADVVVVAIDDETLRQEGGNAPSRKLLARITRAIAAGQPRAVALDIAFPDPKDAEDDSDLADALRSTTAIVAGIGIFNDGGSGAGRDESGPLALAPHASAILWPINAIRDAAQVGLANISTDASGIPRYIPMIYRTPDGVVPSFALIATSTALGADPVFGRDSIDIAGRAKKMDLGYHLPIRYYGPSGGFVRFSAAELLRGVIDPKSLQGRIVVVGMTATGVGDTFATPFDRVAPGAEIFATAIGNLISADTLARTSSTRRLDAAMAIALPAALITLIAMRRATLGLVLATLVFISWGAGVFLAFLNGYWLNMAAPLAASLPPVLAYTAARFLVERRAGRRAVAERSLLSRFQSPLLVDHILRQPDFLERPVRQDVAVLFLDLSGSTGVTEALGPERTRDLLSAMQTLVDREVTARKGVVINYMGDGVLAVFGLPKPRADDAARALVTVESLRTSVSAWLADLPPAARDRLDFRIGLHFGAAVLSRLGSPTHQQITAAGDTVNVASRLLEVAKQQRCRVVVSEVSFEAAIAMLQAEDIDASAYAALEVPIRGRTSGLKIRVRN